MRRREEAAMHCTVQPKTFIRFSLVAWNTCVSTDDEELSADDAESRRFVLEM
jgi:hypothetical protein